MPAADPPPSSTTGRVAAVLRTFQDAPAAGLGATEIGKLTGLDKSVVHRILGQLAGEGLLERDPATRRFHVGVRLWQLGQAYRRGVEDLVGVAREELGELVADSGGTAYVGELVDGDVVYLATVNGPGPLQVHADVGSRVPAHASAMGKAILAYAPDGGLDDVLPDGPLEALTPATVTDRDALRADFARTRERGYATNHQEQVRGVGAIGVPLFAAGRALPRASISVAFPLLPGYDRLWVDLPERLVAVGRRVEERCGLRAAR